MGGICRFINSWLVVPTYRKEAAQFLEMLKGLSAEERELVFISVIKFADMFEREEHLLLWNPLEISRSAPDIVLYCNAAAKILRERGAAAAAPAPILWCHTYRAECVLEIKWIVKEIWYELECYLAPETRRYPMGFDPA